jgi:hypothetical protein
LRPTDRPHGRHVPPSPSSAGTFQPPDGLLPFFLDSLSTIADIRRLSLDWNAACQVHASILRLHRLQEAAGAAALKHVRTMWQSVALAVLTLVPMPKQLRDVDRATVKKEIDAVNALPACAALHSALDGLGKVVLAALSTAASPTSATKALAPRLSGMLQARLTAA